MEYVWLMWMLGYPLVATTIRCMNNVFGIYELASFKPTRDEIGSGMLLEMCIWFAVGTIIWLNI